MVSYYANNFGSIQRLPTELFLRNTLRTKYVHSKQSILTFLNNPTSLAYLLQLHFSCAFLLAEFTFEILIIFSQQRQLYVQMISDTTQHSVPPIRHRLLAFVNYLWLREKKSKEKKKTKAKSPRNPPPAESTHEPPVLSRACNWQRPERIRCAAGQQAKVMR